MFVPETNVRFLTAFVSRFNGFLIMFREDNSMRFNVTWIDVVRLAANDLSFSIIKAASCTYH